MSQMVRWCGWRPAFAAAMGAGLMACSPTLNWREVRPEGTGVVAMFPCRPDHHERKVALGPAPVSMQMFVCGAGGATYALTFFAVDAPAAIAPSLAALRAAALANVAAASPQVRRFELRGMTPSAEAVTVEATGRLPDGKPVQEQAAFFAQGMRVYQASVIGSQLMPQDVEAFFSGLKLPP